MHSKYSTKGDFFSWQVVGTASVIFVSLFFFLWKRFLRLFKRKEWYGRQKTIIKYTSDVNGILKIRNASGLGLGIIQFVFNDSPGICCLSCGPIFHISLQEKDNDLKCSCSLCLLELSSQEKNHIKSFIEKLFSPTQLGNSLVKCSNNVVGCDVVLPLKELNEHVQHCSYTKMPCPHACGMTIERKHMDVHAKLCKNKGIVVQRMSTPYPAPPGFVHPMAPPPPPAYEASAI